VEVQGKDGAQRPVMKLSAEKMTLPGTKQIFRVLKEGEFAYDVIALFDERYEDASPMVQKFVNNGRVLKRESLDNIRKRVAENLARLPESYKTLSTAIYPVKTSQHLSDLSRELIKDYTKS
jgi:nicotinate phosphoribosyltransferase